MLISCSDWAILFTESFLCQKMQIFFMPKIPTFVIVALSVKSQYFWWKWWNLRIWVCWWWRFCWFQCWWPSDSHGDGLVVVMAIGKLRRRQWLWWWEAKTQLEAKSKLRRWAPIVGRGLAWNQKPQKWEGSGFEIRSLIWVLHSCTLLSFHFIDFYGKSLPLMKFQSFEGLAIVGSQGIPYWNTDLSV